MHSVYGNSFRDFTRHVKESAFGQWDYILRQLLDCIDDTQVDTRLRSKGTPCPNCGGTDRYSFKSNDDGGWGCRHCGGGDGFELLKRVNGWTFSEAVKAVAELLLIDAPEDSWIGKRSVSKASKPTRDNGKSFDEVKKLEHQYHKKAAYALQLWNNSPPADSSHPYLISHHLPPFDLKQTQHPIYGWCLLVPLFNEQGTLMNLEQINQDGMKRPIKGGQKKGCFYQFGQQTWTIYISEGWATGAAVHLGRSYNPCVIAAMSSTNLEAVTEITLRRHPDSRIVIVADHDYPGLKAAYDVAVKHDLNIIMPEQWGSDFCDMRVAECSGGHKE